MRLFNFTPQEIRALLFLLTALLIGSGITIYKRQRPDFAPELVFSRSPSSSFENESQPNKASKDTSYGISQGSLASHISDLRVQGSQAQNEYVSQDSDFGISSAEYDPSMKKINLNSASASELELLPRIGPVLSQRIIDYRKTKGRFERIEDLMGVSGIGEKTFEKIRNLITVN